MSTSTAYRPSNGTEGHGFISAWCEICARDKGQNCPILAATFAYDVDDPQYPTEWSFDDFGMPQCTAFVHEDDPVPPARCTKTLDMFAEATP